MTAILNNLLLIGILLVVLMVLYAGATYLWNRKYLPSQLAKGKLKKPLGTILKEINNYTFKEDKGTLLKKASPKMQQLSAYRRLHVYCIIIGLLLFVLTSNPLWLIALPLSFLIGVSRAMPIIQRRTTFLDRTFLIASSSIRFTAGPRAKNAIPPASWNHIQAENWTDGKEASTPSKMIITFPSGNGPEQQAQKGFEKSFELNVTDENIWNFEWDLPHDRVTIEAAPHLPTQLLYPGSLDAKWSVFPVGETSAGVASYDVSVFPHVLVAGPSGTGKSVLQRNIVFHTIQHNDRWRFLGVDLKRVELTPYNKYKKTIMGVATDVEQGVAVLKYAYNEMMDRYKEMENIGVNNVMDMADPPYCILVMVDEATMFLGASGSKTEEGKAEDAMKGEASDLVGKILRLGRAAGIHMLIAMQRPDATVLRGEFKANMDVRLAAGRMDSTPSSMVLDSGEAVNLPGIKGRGLIRVGGNLSVFQGYFAPQDWIDDFILKNPHVEPSCIAPGGHLHDKYQAMKRLEAKAEAETAETAEPIEESNNEGKKGKLGGKSPRKGKKEETSVSAAPAAVEPVVEEPAKLEVSLADDPIDEKKQDLINSLSKKEEDKLEGIDLNELPDFFTGSGRKDEDVAPKKVIEPDLNLDDDDFILDDFDDFDEEEGTEENESVLPPAPANIMTPSTPAPKQNQWVAASPFGGDSSDEVEQPSLPFSEETTVKPAQPSEKKSSVPTRPVRPSTTPTTAPAARPQRPATPFTPKTNGNPFSPKN